MRWKALFSWPVRPSSGSEMSCACWSVLSLVDSLGIRAYQAHAVALEKALLVQLARECQTRLSAETREQAVGALLLYYPLDRLNGQRLEIYLIGVRGRS